MDGITGGGQASDNDTLDVKDMLLSLMTDMKEMKGMMQAQTASVQKAKDEAKSAKQASIEAEMAVCTLEQDVQMLKETALTKEKVEEILKQSMPKYKDIEADIAILRSVATSAGHVTLVIGGLKQQSMEAATSWLHQCLEAAGNKLPEETYKMGPTDEPFKGLLFMKFTDMAEAQSALRTMKSKCFQENKHRDQKDRIWCNFKKPIEERLVTSFLMALRTQLIAWKYFAYSVKVDLPAGALKVAGKVVLKASVENDKFKIEWVESDWEAWKDLTDSPEFIALRKSAEDRLSASRAQTSKGAGKGSMQ